MDNPFSVTFGKKPFQYISRLSQTDELINDLNSSNPPSQAYMITGARGSGKTVMMTAIESSLRENDEWIVEELNSSRDMLQALAARLYTRPELKKKFLKVKLDLSALGIGVSVEGGDQMFDIEVALSRMLDIIKNDGKKLLITIDEVTKSKQIKIFISSFQIFIRNDYPVFLIMTGLYDNIYNLQNDRSLTFLYRAPKIYLEPLNFTAVKKSYKEVFGITSEEAAQMAMITMGYPFAYQSLGYIRWEHSDEPLESLMDEFDRYLDEYVYEKIWSELTEKEKMILETMAEDNINNVTAIREKLDIPSRDFSVYRDRMKKKSVIDTKNYGEISFALPRFDVYIKNHL